MISKSRTLRVAVSDPSFFPQKTADTALTTWLPLTYCTKADYDKLQYLLPGVVLPARLRLSIQTWQSDMVKALQEIEQYCYE